jgi:protein-L-isoaspartate(D-aspartate) O-methyltransferase
MVDNYRHKGLRRQLVQALREKGIHDEKVLEAIGTLPRHYFMDLAFEEKAYEDTPFPIGKEQTISQPYTVAYQTSLLAIEKRDKVLEIGTGSGYQAAILSLLGARVYTIERHESLYLSAKSLLEKMGFNTIRFFWKDGFKGLPEFAPFDKILVTAGAETFPETLLEQLKVGGICVIPVGKKDQYMYKITRISASEYQKDKLDAFRFVPFLEGKV